MKIETTTTKIHGKSFKTEVDYRSISADGLLLLFAGLQIAHWFY